MTTDQTFMLRALELARRGEGLTRPNPPVGAVLVKDGQILAEGRHEKAGEDHAEVRCLRNVKDQNLRGASLYVTLEPCSTHGRTPPCTDLILKRGIGRVAVSVKDCNPKHAGRGLDLLRTHGVEVVESVCEEEGRELIAPFEKFITTGMPFVTLKLALTLDGKIADAQGRSRWITGPAARTRVQAMRRSADAVMTGAGTVRADNPSLLPRPDEGRRPWRVVIGSDIPPSSKILTDEAAGQTLLFSLKTNRPELTEKSGPPVLQAAGFVEVLRDLAGRDIMHVLCEGGGTLAAGLIQAGLVDRYAFFIAPKLLGAEGVPGIGALHAGLAEAPKLSFRAVETIGDDLLVYAVPV